MQKRFIQVTSEEAIILQEGMKNGTAHFFRKRWLKAEDYASFEKLTEVVKKILREIGNEWLCLKSQKVLNDIQNKSNQVNNVRHYI